MANPEQQQKPEQRQTLKPITLRGFVKAAEQAVQQSKVNMAMKLARGGIGTMEQYNRQVGQMEGMEQAMALLRDMLGQIEDAERNSDLQEMPE